MSDSVRLYAAVAAGSALGAVARYLVSAGLVAVSGPGVGLGTLVVNVLGSVLIGFHYARTASGGESWAARHHFVTTGFCGGFTTFSIFSLETLQLAQSGAPGLAAASAGVAVSLWLAGVWAGHAAGLATARRS